MAACQTALLTVKQAVPRVRQRLRKMLYANNKLDIFRRLMLSRQVRGFAPFCAYSGDFLAAMVQHIEVPHREEIVAMDFIAKLFNPIIPASAAQGEHCHA